MSFPNVLQQQLKGKKLQCLGHKHVFLKVAMLLANAGKKGESLVLYCACHTTTFEEDVEKNMFLPTFLQQLLKQYKLQRLGTPKKLMNKKQNMNIIKHIVQNIKSGNHKKVAKFGSLMFFGKNLEQTPKMR